MCGGSKPKVDTSFQDWSKEEAATARKDEEARQNRVDYGLDQIRTIFEGGKTKGTPVAAKGSYDPKKTYYNKDGSVFRPAAQKKVTKKVRVTPGKAATKTAAPAVNYGWQTGPRPGTPKKTSSLHSPITTGRWRYKRPQTPAVEGMGAVMSPAVNATYKNVTSTTGLTAAQQFAKALSGLKMAGAGKTYAGVEPILAARKKAQEQYYLPQLDEQRDDAKEQLVYALARAGLGVSTTAKERNVEVDEGFNRERAGVRSKIAADISGARGDYEQQRQSLESQLRASGDATAATEAATRGMATFAKDAPELRPLENALLGLTTGIGGAKQAYDVAQIRERARGGSTVNRNLSRTVG